jgi:hypothetical protein
MIKGLLARKDSCPMLVGGVNSAAPTDGLSQSLNNQPPTPGLDRTLPGTPMLPLTLRSTDVVLVRHGETAWSRSGQHTGSTDIPLTPAGELAARALAPFLEQLTFARVFCSPLARARRTAELAGFGTRLELTKAAPAQKSRRRRRAGWSFATAVPTGKARRRWGRGWIG